MGGLFSKKHIKVSMIGLDNSGKSTIVNRLKPESRRAVDITATLGYSVEKVQTGKAQFTIIDMSGQGKYRSMWGSILDSAEAVVFVLDASDKLRVTVAREELETILSSAQLKAGAPVLVFANKMDIDGALTRVQTVQMLHLDDVSSRPWRVIESCALDGRGLEEGFHWLTERL